MKHKLLLLLCAVLMILQGACACFGVTVTGKGGDASLSQIGDIIRHVTGNTSDDLKFEKDSLYMLDICNKSYQREILGGPVEAHETDVNGKIYSFNNVGSNDLSGSFSDIFSDNPFVSGLGSLAYHYIETASNYQRASAVQTSTVRNTDNGKLLLNFAIGSDNNLENGANAYAMPDNGSVRFDHSSNWRTVGDGVSGTFVGAEAGIKVKDYDGELVAMLMRNNEKFSVYLAKVNADNSGLSPELVSASWSKTLDSNNVPKMFDGTVYFPLSMAVGDFDNDGYTDEIVVADTDRTAIHYTVLKIAHTGSTSQDASFSVSEFQKGDVETYSYANEIYRERGVNMDGLSCTYSLCTVHASIYRTIPL